MAETSGFFQGMWDESLKNPTTEEYTGWWDRAYVSKQFMDYFSLFVGNGVFISPTNQLKVVPGAGRTVIVSTGWAFINGGWYNNDSELLVEIPANNSSTNRVDSIRVRYSNSDRKISVVLITGETGVVRGDTIWDLEIAQVITTPGFTTISAANISDMRTDENVCGFVKGLLEVVSTNDLFNQFQAIFEEWFDTVKNQVTGDLAIRLQQEFEELNQNVINYKNETNQNISTYKSDTDQMIYNYKYETSTEVLNYKTDMQGIVDDYKSSADKAVNESTSLVNDYVDKDFVIEKQVLTFNNNICKINNEKITANTLVDVYFTPETIDVAAKANIYVDSYNGYIQLTAEITPTGNIEAIIRVRVR